MSAPLGIANSPRVEATLQARVLIVIAAAAAYGTLYWPSPLLRSWARSFVERPQYEGPWGLLSHALLYTTLGALACATVWALLARRGWLEPLRPVLRLPTARAAGWAIVIGAVVSAFNAGAYVAFAKLGLEGGGALRPHWQSGWVIAGNLFSNFYEELIYRGLLLTAAIVVFRSRAAALTLTAVVFAFSHTQYAPALQLMLAWSGVLLGAMTLFTRNLWPAWIAHMVGDLILDSLL